MRFARPPLSGLSQTALCCALLGATWLSACSHNYIYRPDNLPEVRAGKLLHKARPSDEAEPMTIERVSVVRVTNPTRFERPTHYELRSIGKRVPLSSLEAVRFKVSTSSRVWSEYALVGFGIGMSFGAMLGLLVAEDGDSGALIPIVIGVSLGVGLEGMLIGAAVGSLATQGTTDHRLDGRPSSAVSADVRPPD